MSETRIKNYEGLFLFPQSATADLQSAADHVRDILTRNHAEIVALKKFDERRLAYDVKGNKRGLYILTYFKANTQHVLGIERDCNLSEKMLRSLVSRADHLTEDQMRAADGQQQIADEAKLRDAAPATPAGATEGA